MQTQEQTPDGGLMGEFTLGGWAEPASAEGPTLQVHPHLSCSDCLHISYLDENFSSFQGCRTNRFMTTRFTMYVVDVMFI